MDRTGESSIGLRHVALTGALLGVTLLPACSRSGTAPTQKTSRPATPPGATLAIAGQLLTGDDPEALRAYLRTVKEVVPKRFKVEWNPATVAVGRDEAIRSLRAISQDGARYTFAASEPVVGRIHPGSILWIWDIAVRRVDQVDASGDAVVIETRPVALSEALTNADIAFESAVSVPDYYMAWRPPKPKPQTTAERLRRLGLIPASLRSDEPDAPPEPSGSEEDRSAGEGNEDGQGFGEPTGDGFNGSLKGFEYSLQYASRPGGLRLGLEARKADEGGGGGESDTAGSAELKKKFKEADEEEKEAREKLEEAKKQLEKERKDLDELDREYERQRQQLEQDQANRHNPSFEGPRPPPPPTDSNGTPLTEQAERDRLAREHERKRSTETAKMAEIQRIRDEALARKEKAEALKRGLKAARKVAGKLFEIASENLDVRLRAIVDLHDFDVSGGLTIDDGSVENASAQFRNLQGHVTLSFIGRFGQKGNGAVKVPVMEVPIAFNLPLPVGGIPFVVQVGADFTLNVFLAGQHAAMSFNGSYAFSGSSGFHADRSGSQPDTQLSGEQPAIADYTAMSPGVSAAVLGVQLPRLGIGLGVLGISSVAYFDVVNVMTVNNSATVALGLTPHCRRVTYTAAGHVGIDTNVVPIPIPFADKVNKQLSPKKEIFNVKKEILDPPIKACEVD